VSAEVVAREVEQGAALRKARRRATGLLAIVGVGFVASFWLPDTTATGYLRAALEAGLVGGLADWFAVVALFRYPLGIPIPHTAVIPRSKAGLGANMATFVQDNFLHPDQVKERLADTAHVQRLGGWLEVPGNADQVARQITATASTVLDAMNRDQVVGRIVEGVRARLARVPVAKLSGQALQAALRDRRHDALVTATINGLRDTASRNRTGLRRRLGEQSPSWVPGVVDDLVFGRAEEVVHTFLMQVADDPQHELRVALDVQLDELAVRLQSDPTLEGRAVEVVQDVISDELLHRWVDAWWDEVKERVAAAARPDATDSALRRLMAEALVGLGDRLGHDPDLQGRVVGALEAIAPQLAQAGQQEIGHLIAATIDRWDVEDTSRRLELWMGPDLQFVRINGTVVGALVGIVLHAGARLLG